MTPMAGIGAFLVFGVATMANAAQSVTAVPYADMARCERAKAAALAELAAGERVAPRRPVTIRPYCTTQAPAFWVPPREASFDLVHGWPQ